jgi:hypothetical protein
VLGSTPIAEINNASKIEKLTVDQRWRDGQVLKILKERVMLEILLIAGVMNVQQRYEIKARWQSFCERHLVADDPYDEQEPRLKMGPWGPYFEVPEENSGESDEPRNLF